MSHSAPLLYIAIHFIDPPTTKATANGEVFGTSYYNRQQCCDGAISYLETWQTKYSKIWVGVSSLDGMGTGNQWLKIEILRTK